MWKHYEKMKMKIKKILQPFEAPEDKIYDTSTCHVELEQVNFRTAVIRMVSYGRSALQWSSTRKNLVRGPEGPESRGHLLTAASEQS